MGNITFNYYDLAHLQRFLVNLQVIPDNPLIKSEWNQQIRVSLSLWEDNIKALSLIHNLQTTTPLMKLNSKESRYLFHNYKIRAFWEEAVFLSTGSNTFTPSIWWKKTDDGVTYYLGKSFQIFCTLNLMVIKSPYGNALVSRDHLLILSDLASQRYILKMASILESRKPRPDFPSLESLEVFLDIGDKILEISGNPGYKYIYTLEPECVSMLVKDIPTGTSNGKPFKKLILFGN